MKNEMLLVESKTAREEMITKDYVLDKVKALALLQDNTHVTTEMVANYYEVPEGTIKSLISENNEELRNDGLKTLKGEELKHFKGELDNPTTLKFVSSLIIIPRRAILRIGMLLRDSEIAKQVRTYLLNVEENTDTNTRLISLSEDIHSNVKRIITENQELKHQVHMLINKVDDLLEQPLFKIYKNSSREYDKLIFEFVDIMESIGIRNRYSSTYTFFNVHFTNWTGVDFGNKQVNKKQYWLNFYGIELIKEFIYGIKQGILKMNDNGNWVCLQGIYSNKVEWNKILKDFNNNCAYCGSDHIILADHIIPQSKDKSTDILYNLIPCCQKCNDERNTMDINNWFTKKELPVEQIEKIKAHWKKYYIQINC